MTTQQLHTSCIICGDAQSMLRRGLCPKHHARYVKAASKMTCDERSAFESDLVKKGLLLPSKQGRRLQPEQDEFAVAAAEFLRQTHPSDDYAGPPPTILDVLLPGPATTEPRKKPRKRQATKPASEE